MPSRLKGIETTLILPTFFLLHGTLDMPSRLKGIETKNQEATHSPQTSLDMPSRLKGIETYCGNDVTDDNELWICLPV